MQSSVQSTKTISDDTATHKSRSGLVSDEFLAIVAQLKPMMSRCSLTEMNCLANCLGDSVTTLAQGPQTDIEGWRKLRKIIQRCSKEVHTVIANNPSACQRGTRRRQGGDNKWSCGIQEASCETDTLPPPRKFHPENHCPDDVLEVLRRMELKNGDSYWLCHTCEIITSVPEDHVQEDATIRHAMRTIVMSDIIDLAKKFGQKFDACLRAELNLDLNDVHALYIYTLETEIYSTMNRVMRSMDLLSPEFAYWQPLIHHTNVALSKLPSYPREQLYRGIQGSATYQVNSFVQWAAFSSSTSNSEIVESFTGNGGTLFIIRPLREGSQGRLIKFMSAFEEEDEVLFGPNSYFHVHQRMGPGPKRLLSQTLGINLDYTEVFELHEVDWATAEKEVQQMKSNKDVEIEANTRQAIQFLWQGEEAKCYDLIKKGVKAVVPGCQGDISLWHVALSKQANKICSALLKRRIPLPKSLRIEERYDIVVLLDAIKQLGESLQSICIGEWALEAPSGQNLITYLSQLEHLDMSESGKVGAKLISVLCPRLTSLGIGFENGIGHEGAEAIAHLKLLESLSICHRNEIGSEGAKSLARLTKLTSLTIGHGNGIRQEGVKELSCLTRLTSLTIGNDNGIGSQGAKALAQLGQLTSLIIGDDNCIGPEGAEALSQLRQMTTLTIGGDNGLGPEGAKALARLAQLTSLTIGNDNGIRTEGAKALTELTRLTSLFIGAGNNIGPEGSEILGQMAQLTSLTIKCDNSFDVLFPHMSG